MDIEEYNKIRRLLDFAGWYLDGMEPSNEAYKLDKPDILEAEAVIHKYDQFLQFS
jgi:hypothetical protein